MTSRQYSFEQAGYPLNSIRCLDLQFAPTASSEPLPLNDCDFRLPGSDQIDDDLNDHIERLAANRHPLPLSEDAGSLPPAAISHCPFMTLSRLVRSLDKQEQAVSTSRRSCKLPYAELRSWT